MRQVNKHTLILVGIMVCFYLFSSASKPSGTLLIGFMFSPLLLAWYALGANASSNAVRCTIVFAGAVRIGMLAALRFMRGSDDQLRFRPVSFLDATSLWRTGWKHG
jgi:hypothetical protein